MYISYILMVGIGMLFYSQKYGEFGINIFDYADIFDFLIAPFGDYRIIVFTVFSSFVPILFFQLDHWCKTKYPSFYSKISMGMDKKSWYKTYWLVSYVALICSYLYLGANFYGRLTKKEILAQEPINLKYSDDKVERGIFIGKTKEVIFITSDNKVKAIPIVLLKEFEINSTTTE